MLKNLFQYGKKSVTGKGDFAYGHSFYEDLLDTEAVAFYCLKNGGVVRLSSNLMKNLGYREELWRLSDIFDIDKSEFLLDWEKNIFVRDVYGNKNIYLVKNRVFKDYTGNIIKIYGIVKEMLPAGIADNAFIEQLWSIFGAKLQTPFAILDKDGMIVKVNLPFSKIVSKDNTYLKNLHLADIFNHEYQKDIRNFLSEIKKNPDQIFEHKKSIKIKGIEDVRADIYISYISSPDSDLSAYTVIMMDVSDQKILEEKLIHSQRLNAIGQLAGGVAHDFNNLLTAIMGYCELALIRYSVGTQTFSDIMQIKQNAARAARLVKQLLAFSRKQTMQPTMIQVSDIIYETKSMLDRLIGENIKLVVESSRDSGFIKADPGQIEQVIINLAVNARDAINGEGKSGNVTIRSKKIAIGEKHVFEEEMFSSPGEVMVTAGEYAVIEVEDDGCGIPKDIIEKIFDPFFTTKDVGAGTGLGLSTVYGIIKQSGGSIFVRSKLGVGTCFSIFMTLYGEQEAEQYNKITHSSSDLEEIEVQDITGIGTILVVEDEMPVRMFCVSVLKGQGYEVLEAECAEDALEIFEEREADISAVVTDVMMPGMNGPTMAIEIRKKNQLVPIIFVSGYGEDVFTEMFGVEDRNFHFLPKPYSLKQLAHKIKICIST